MSHFGVVRILFIGDNCSYFKSAIKELRNAKLEFSSLRADTKPSFLQALDTFKPNLIIYGYGMSQLDSMTVLAISKQRNQSLPFIVLAESKDESAAIACVNAGADVYVLQEYISKLPFAIFEVLAANRGDAKEEETVQLFHPNEEPYKACFYDSEAICFLLNPTTLTILDANRLAAEYFRQSSDELIGKNIRELLNFNENMIGESVGKAMNSGEKHYNFQYQGANREIYNIEAFSAKLVLNRKTFILLWLCNSKMSLRDENKLRALTVRAVKIRELERKNLALFLHDEIGQKLTTLRMMLETQAIKQKIDIASDNFMPIMKLLNQTLVQTRSMVTDLSPASIYKQELPVGLRYKGETICKNAGLKFSYSYSGQHIPLSKKAEQILYRSIEELMWNVVHHAKATEMMLSIHFVDNILVIRLSDNGIGFDPNIVNNTADHVGFGLFSINEYISSINGRMKIKSEIGKGTCFTLSVGLNSKLSYKKVHDEVI